MTSHVCGQAYVGHNTTGNYIAVGPDPKAVIATYLASPEAEKALAEVTHQDCLDDWQRRPPGSAITQHGVDAHEEAAKRRLAAWRKRP